MTMSNILKKLRNYNKSNYNQFEFCITFAVLLMTAMMSIAQMPIVQLVFPVGGDSRKQLYLILSVSIIGCVVFSLYAASLFLRNKTKEIGVMLALGTVKKELIKPLNKEIISIVLKCGVIGVVLGEIVTFVIWQGFSQFIVNKEYAVFSISVQGILWGVIFDLIIGILIVVMSTRTIKKADVISIIKAQNTREKVGEVSKKHLVVGMILIVSGIFFGFLLPKIIIYTFDKKAPGILNVIMLLSVVGTYMVIEYAVIYHKKGKNPKKYYKNLVSYGMIKFEGKQNIRNMLVVSVLCAVSIFAASYISNVSSSVVSAGKSNPYEFVIYRPLVSSELNKNDIEELANKSSVTIKDYKEIEFACLSASGVERDYDDNGNVVENYKKDHSTSEFISQSEYEKITGEKVNVEKGKYIRIVHKDESENFFTRYDDMDYIEDKDSKQGMKISFQGTIPNEYMLTNNCENRYILNDEDYKKIASKVGDSNKVQQIIFNTANEEKSYEFAKNVYVEFLKRADKEMANPNTMYDEGAIESMGLEGTTIELDKDNPDLMGYWKWYPSIKTYDVKNFAQSVAVYFLVFSFISVICLAASAIMLYSRSISVASRNKDVFEDLEKLGANKRYVRKCLKQQISKLFTVPAILGVTLSMLLTGIMFVMNDGKISESEVIAYSIDSLIFIAVLIFIFIVYKYSLNKCKKILDIEK